MADWDQLRALAREVVPPELAALERTARRRQRRARAALGAVAALVLVGGGIGLLTTDREGSVEPVQDPVETHTGEPRAVLPLPGAEPGQTSFQVSAGRYRVPLDGTLAFDVDLPDDTSVHDDGVFLATESFVLKVELAGRRYGVPRHPCTDHRPAAVGPTVEDLVRALVEMPVYVLSRPRTVRLGGLDATYLEARVPPSHDASRCTGDAVRLPGNPLTAVSGPAPYIGRWWVLDVEGQRVVVQQNCWGCPADGFDQAPRTPQSMTFTTTD